MKKRTSVMVVSTVVILLLVVLLAFGYRKNDDKPLLNGDYALSPDERYVAFSLAINLFKCRSI
jgi:hypothetical protein